MNNINPSDTNVKTFITELYTHTEYALTNLFNTEKAPTQNKTKTLVTSLRCSTGSNNSSQSQNVSVAAVLAQQNIDANKLADDICKRFRLQSQTFNQLLKKSSFYGDFKSVLADRLKQLNLLVVNPKGSSKSSFDIQLDSYTQFKASEVNWADNCSKLSRDQIITLIAWHLVGRPGENSAFLAVLGNNYYTKLYLPILNLGSSDASNDPPIADPPLPPLPPSTTGGESTTTLDEVQPPKSDVATTSNADSSLFYGLLIGGGVLALLVFAVVAYFIFRSPSKSD
jgi:hypothetical protein